MKALTLWRPWPAAICYFGKRVENRTWCPPAYLLGQDLAIHAGVRIDEAEVEDLIYNEDDARAVLPGHMGIVAIVRVAGVIDARSHPARLIPAQGVDPAAIDDERHLDWWVGPVGWVLDRIRPLSEPVPCRGAQGLWDLPPDIEAAVTAAMLPALPEVGA